MKTWGKNELKISAQLGFSSEVKVPQLGSAPNLPSLAQLEPENSSSGSSLLSRVSGARGLKEKMTPSFLIC